MTPDIAVATEAGAWPAEAEDLALKAALAAAGELDEAAELSVVLADDAFVQDLNRRYRGQDKPTNVLSFAALDDEDAPRPEGAPVLLGDVILAFETCAAEAAAQRKDFAHHLAHLVVHGVLHLLGYDHQDEEEAGEMETLERSVLAGMGIPDPYCEA